MKKIYSLFLVTMLIFFTGCNKLVSVNPETSLNTDRMLADDGSAEGALVGLYAKLNGSFCITNGYLSRYLSLYADDLTKINNNSSSDNAFLKSSILPNETVVWELYSNAYNFIYQANLLIENVKDNPNISLGMAKQIEGEAKCIRSLLYFYLVNLFGDVPLVLQTNPDATYKIPRTAQNAIYQQMVADLRDAQALLPATYRPNTTVSSDRIRANKWTAVALLARVYLYNKDFANASIQSNLVINSGMFALEPATRTFLAESKETILGLFPTSLLYNTAEGRYFGIAQNSVNIKPTFVLQNQVPAIFSSGDLRLQVWIRKTVYNNQTYYVPDKYKVFESKEVKEYNIVLRLAEQYFIRAEANAKLGNIPAAVADLNIIRKRAGLQELSTGLSLVTFVKELENEKRREYFCEWGHRWFDIKRWSGVLIDPKKTRAEEIMPVIKPTWSSYMLLLPIPADELKKSTLLWQNDGYR